MKDQFYLKHVIVPLYLFVNNQITKNIWKNEIDINKKFIASKFWKNKTRKWPTLSNIFA